MKLYLIATGNYSKEEFLWRIEESIKGGVEWVQLRIKDKEKLGEILEKALLLKKNYSFTLIVNDFPEFGLKADGVHVGKDDPPPQWVRKIIGEEKILGVSCYNDIERAKRAEGAGANYVAFGSLFPTTTKREYVLVDKKTIFQAKKELKAEICVIGGINKDNFDQVLALEPDIIAISSAIFASPNPFKEAYFFKGKMLYYKYRKQGGEMKEEQLRQRLLKENPEFRQLYEQHQNYERELEKLLSRVPLSKEEEIEVKKIKKLKLKIKDRMQEILVKEKERRVG